jgi:hypothetical protein
MSTPTLNTLPEDILLLISDFFTYDSTLDPSGEVPEDIREAQAQIMNLAHAYKVDYTNRDALHVSFPAHGTLISQELRHLSRLETRPRGSSTARSIIAFNPKKLLDQSHQSASDGPITGEEKRALRNVTRIYIPSITGPSLGRRITEYSARHDNLYKDCHAIFEAARARMKADPNFLSNIESIVLMSGAL